MITVNNAHRLIQNAVGNSISESVQFNESNGRILAQDIHATIPQPIFDNSAMDGFALRYSDIEHASEGNPSTLKLVGTVAAGSSPDINIIPGTCAQIMTGAPVPPGADVVVMVEQTGGFDSVENVKFFNPATLGQNIRYAGEEVEKGQLLIPSKTQITPGIVGILATFGYDKVLVNKRPKIAVFGLGDELKEPGETLEPGQIYNSNLHVLSALVNFTGAELVHSGLLKDDANAIYEFLTEAVRDCDIIVSSGGISMGKFDHIRNVMKRLGVTEEFWRVAQKPGKPLFFGTVEGKLLFGLPGNPVSSFIGFLEYIDPAIRKFMGCDPHPKSRAKLAESFPCDRKKHRFLFGKLWTENGILKCAPTKRTGSHMLTSALGVNCLMESPPRDTPLAPGEEITVKLLPWSTIIGEQK